MYISMDITGRIGISESAQKIDILCENGNIFLKYGERRGRKFYGIWRISKYYTMSLFGYKDFSEFLHYNTDVTGKNWKFLREPEV